MPTLLTYLAYLLTSLLVASGFLLVACSLWSAIGYRGLLPLARHSEEVGGLFWEQKPNFLFQWNLSFRGYQPKGSLRSSGGDNSFWHFCFNFGILFWFITERTDRELLGRPVENVENPIGQIPYGFAIRSAPNNGRMRIRLNGKFP